MGYAIVECTICHKSFTYHNSVPLRFDVHCHNCYDNNGLPLTPIDFPLNVQTPIIEDINQCLDNTTSVLAAFQLGAPVTRFRVKINNIYVQLKTLTMPNVWRPLVANRTICIAASGRQSCLKTKHKFLFLISFQCDNCKQMKTRLSQHYNTHEYICHCNRPDTAQEIQPPATTDIVVSTFSHTDCLTPNGH